jgi:uncharacterized repeat protein (TIGR01451 family)
MGTRTNSRRSRGATRRGLASFVSFLLLFAFALGQSSSMIALADDAGTDPVATEDAVSGDLSPDATSPVAEAPSEEAPAEEAPAEEAPAEEAPAADDGAGGSDGSTDAGVAGVSGSTPRSHEVNTARANRDAAIAAPTAAPAAGLAGGDISLDFVAAGPFTYNHATGLGTHPQFGYDNRTISKTNGVVESLEGGDFECDDLVTFFVQVRVAGNAGGSGAVELDMSFGAETTGQPGLGFDDVVSWGINTPDDGNVALDGTETVTQNNETLDTQGYDEVKSTFTVSGLDAGETAIVRITVHLACEVGASPTGNILNAIDAARVVGDGTVNVGQETVPMKQVGGLQAEPLISVTKDCPATVPFGEDITYEITVSNDGNEALTGLSVIDTLLGNITAEFPNTTLEVGEINTVSVTYSPAANEDPVENTVTAEATGDISATDVSATDSCTTDVLHEPGIDVTKSCPESVPFGEDITYTITVENTGNEALEGVTVDDTLLGDITGEFDFDFANPFPVGGLATANVAYSPGADEDPVTNTVTATGTGADSGVEASDEASCTTDVLHPAIGIVKDGPALVHRGDTITYVFEVTNPGELELFDVELTDPRCDLGTIQLVDNGDGSSGLAVGEVWHYACTHLVTDADPDPIPNTGTVRGDTNEGEGGEEVTDSDDHVVDLIHPGIDIVKTVSEDTVPVGTTVTYTYVVTNTGDTTLYGISVDDDILGHIGDIEVLEPGQSVTLTKDFVVGNRIVINVATVEGEDILGRSVSADDDATVSPIAGQNPPPNNPPTPFTGSDAGRLGLITMVLFGIGVTVIASTRRRRSEREAA